ncbi:MAG: Arc family DNA binding domain-containing protein [Cytophagaceae bacterium]|nr:Arc family DNA binding domain-containing protein [Gemmatimonadaceae bacterium]
MDRDLLDAVQRWANDDLRSLNAQIEFLLRKALLDARRDREKKS